MRFAFIKQHRAVWPVTVMGRVLKVTRQGFHAWLNRAPSVRADRRDALAKKARRIHEASGPPYGSPRVQRQLVKEGEPISENTVASVMRPNAILAAKSKAPRPRTTDSNHDFPITPDLLERDFDASRPNEKWVADITYLPTLKGWCYLGVIMDLYSRRIVGWHVADHLKAELVGAAFRLAMPHRQPGSGVIFHSDRGVPYASQQLAKLAQSGGPDPAHEPQGRLSRQRADGELERDA
jgi:transposase InsO family protein